MNARFILSKSKLLDQYNNLKGKGLDVSYSVKTNPIVGQVLEKETECMFSVHSKTELDFLEDKSRVWYLAESWDSVEIEDLLGQGISSFVVHNENDLNKLLGFLDGKETRINLLLRAKLKENTIFTGKYFVFGMGVSKINELVEKLRPNKNIGKLGVHFHRKTQNVSEWDLMSCVKDMIKPENLERIDILNIGGGLPVIYKNTGDGNLEHILSRVGELKSWLDTLNVKTIIEPGRFLSGPPIRLEATIVNIFENNIVINCSVYNSSMDTVIVPIKLVVEGELESGNSYTIKGNTPCSMDIFRYNVHLPEKKVGDRIVFLNAGAYNFRTDFCSLPKIETVIVG